MAVGFQFEVLDSSELAQRLKVRESWVIDQKQAVSHIGPHSGLPAWET